MPENAAARACGTLTSVSVSRSQDARSGAGGRTSAVPRHEHRELLGALPAGAQLALVGRGGHRGHPCSPPHARRRCRRLGPPGVNEQPRPAFYALPAGGWRDYVTLLHVPYTLWHLSYVVIGAALAPAWLPDRLVVALVAFFLALGIGAHALDELQGRPLATQIPRRSSGRSRRLSSPALSRSASSRRSPGRLAARLRWLWRLHRHRLQPRALRRGVPWRRVVRGRLGRASRARGVPRRRRAALLGRRSCGDLRRCPELRAAVPLDAGTPAAPGGARTSRARSSSPTRGSFRSPVRS